MFSRMVRKVFGAAFVLTVASWIFFYVATPDAPLSGPAVTVVFGFWAGVAFAAISLWKRFAKREKPHAAKD